MASTTTEHTNLSILRPQSAKLAAGYDFTHFNLKSCSDLSTPDLSPSPSQTPSIDLRSGLSTPQDDEKQEFLDLPPVDGGKGAWSYLAAAFAVEALCWGFPFSYGVFQSFYSTHPSFAGDKMVTVAGTLSSGIPYICGPVIFPVIAKYPRYRKTMMWSGLTLCVLSCVASSFATETWHLILTQGAMYGTGSMLLYSPTFSMMNEWFVARRGLAYGLMFGGTGLSGLVLPFVFEYLLNGYGNSITMRIWAITMAVLTTPAIFFVNGRLPHSHKISTPKVDLSFLKSTTFYIFAVSNLLQGIGYFLPSIYLPSYAIDLSLSSLKSTILLSLFNLATVFGQIAFGHFSDCTDVHIPLFISSFVSGLSVYFLWGYAKSFAPLVAFSLVYGLFAGGYGALFSRFATKVAGEDQTMALTVMSVFGFGRGVGNILSGPISSLLIGGVRMYGGYAIGKYEGMVLFVGSMLIASSLGAGGRFWVETRR